MMERRTPVRTPVESRYAFDYSDLEETEPRVPDLRDLGPEDRKALGLTSPKFAHHVPDIGGDAASALRELLAQGGAIGKDVPAKARKR